MNKKGQAVFDELGKLAVGIVVVALVLAVVFVILSNLSDQAVDRIDTSSVSNESVAWSNYTYVALAGDGGLTLSCSTVYNGTSGVVIGSANYTCDTAGINLTDGSPANFSWATNVLVSYTYTQPSIAYNVTETTRNETDQIPDWVGIMVIVAIGAIILFMIRGFGSRR